MVGHQIDLFTLKLIYLTLFYSNITKYDHLLGLKSCKISSHSRYDFILTAIHLFQSLSLSLSYQSLVDLCRGLNTLFCHYIVIN